MKVNSPSIPHLNLSIESDNKIVFLTFEMSLLDSIKDTYSFKLINEISKDGVLKERSFNKELVVEKNYLYVRLSNKFGEVSTWIKANDPLNTLYEFPDDRNNSFGNTVVFSKNSTLTFRFQSNKNLNFISIYKPTIDLKLKKIYYAIF